MRELRERDARQRLRMLQRQRARDGDRRHGAGEAERRHDHGLAVAREIDDALRHGAVEHARRVAVDDRVAVGAAAEGVLGEAARQPDEGEAVLDLLGAASHHDRHLVREGELRPHHGVVAQVDGHVLRLRVIAEHVQHVEMLAELDQLEEVRERARAAAAIEVAHVGTARAADEDERARREFDGAARIAAEPREGRRTAPERGGDDLAADSHDLRALIDQRAGARIQLPRLRQQHLDAERLEHPQGVLVHRGDGVVRERTLRCEGTAQPPV